MSDRENAEKPTFRGRAGVDLPRKSTKLQISLPFPPRFLSMTRILWRTPRSQEKRKLSSRSWGLTLPKLVKLAIVKLHAQAFFYRDSLAREAISLYLRSARDCKGTRLPMQRCELLQRRCSRARALLVRAVNQRA